MILQCITGKHAHGLDSDSILTRENEYAIIENTYQKGYAAAKLLQVRTGKKVAVDRPGLPWRTS